MPPTKRKASKNVSSGGSDDEGYLKKRARNNQVSGFFPLFALNCSSGRTNNETKALSFDMHFLEFEMLFLAPIVFFSLNNLLFLPVMQSDIVSTDGEENEYLKKRKRNNEVISCYYFLFFC